MEKYKITSFRDSKLKTRYIYSCSLCDYVIKENKKAIESHCVNCIPVIDNRLAQRYLASQIQQAQLIEDNRINENPIAAEQYPNEIFQHQLNDLRERINLMEDNFSQVDYRNKAIVQRIISNLMKMCEVQWNLQLKKLFASWNKVKIGDREAQITLAIMAKIRNIDYNTLVTFSQERLRQLNKKWKEQAVDNKSKLKRLQRGFIFWKEHAKSNFYFQTKIYDDLLSLSKRKFRDIKSYHNSMMNHKYKFPHLIEIPQYICKQHKYQKRKLPKIKLQDVIKEVLHLYQQNQKQLSLDLWLSCCMGLRKQQLLSLRIRDQNGKFYNVIKVYQQKNKHTTHRYIPDSLCQLAVVANINLPLTTKRIQKLRRYCMKLFGRFYGLRALCLTVLSSTIFQQSIYAQFHVNPSTTNQYYLNKDSKILINSAFKLHESFGSISFERNQKGIYIDQSRQIHEFKEVDNVSIEKWKFDFQQEVILDQASRDTQDIDLSQMSSTEKQQLYAARYLMSLKQQLDPLIYQSQKQALKSYFESDGETIKMIDAINSPLTEQEISGHLQYAINIVQLPQQIQINHLQSIKEIISQVDNAIEQQRQNKCIILRSKNHCFVNQSHAYSQRVSARISSMNSRNKRSLQIEFNGTDSSPICKKCKKNALSFEYCHNQHYFIQCFSCNFSIHDQCFFKSEQNSQNNPLIQSKSKKQHFLNLNKLELMSKKNNINQHIDSQYYLHQNIYSNAIPKYFTTNIHILAQQDSKIVRENISREQYLPLQIRQSMKGKGVFALSDIKQNCMLCSYFGRVQLLQQTLKNSKYTFDYLWMINPKVIKYTVINSAVYRNIGSFINSKNKPNCKANKIMLQHGGRQQLVIIFISCRPIKCNEEINFDYSETFWNSEENQYLSSEQQVNSKINHKQEIYQQQQDLYLEAEIAPQAKRSTLIGPWINIEDVGRRQHQEDVSLALMRFGRQNELNLKQLLKINGNRQNSAYRAILISFLTYADNLSSFFDKVSNNTLRQLNGIEIIQTIQKRLQKIIKSFNQCQDFDSDMIENIRQKVCNYLKINWNKLKHLSETKLKQSIEQVSLGLKDTKQLQIVILSQVLSIKISMQIITQNGQYQNSSTRQQKDKVYIAQVWLLKRPYHYDYLKAEPMPNIQKKHNLQHLGSWIHRKIEINGDEQSQSSSPQLPFNTRKNKK